ncbi:LysR family transcriptional regulator [Paenibacillus glycanilyticus]|uniref:LysR family transcriptional regulator n=1 Tax=Paenibacillus glycanilyticus TaxID=126569 RepID=UPI000FDA466D|nr:LysR family transcriptional regulator [Paenibacillus glycanilyticus]
MIDFEWYRSFVSIYKHRSVSAAAQARMMTQPAMSQHLAALEADVGGPLFIRAPRKMIPTNKGKELYTRIVPHIENLESISLEVKYAAPEGAAPVVRIGAPAEYFTYQAASRLNGLELRFIVRFGIAEFLLDDLQKDELDIIITTQNPQISGIEYARLEIERFFVTAPADCEVDVDEISGIEGWLASCNWLSYGLELPIIRRFWREHFGKRPELQATHIIPDLRGILSAVEHGMGISVLPAYLIEDAVRRQRCRVLFPELSVENIIYAAFKLEKKENPLLAKLLESLQDSGSGANNLSYGRS